MTVTYIPSVSENPRTTKNQLAGGVSVWFKTLLWVSVITSIKLYFLWAYPLNLFFDEAQYWIWSQQPDFGYYSKPPMVAWFIAATTSVCGDTPFCIRMSSPLIHMGTALLIYAIARRLYSNTVGYYSALVYVTLPAVFLSSFLISTDPFLLFFWTLSLFAFVQALHTHALRWWCIAGLAAGAGLLSKYTMLIFFFSSLGFLWYSPTHRVHLRQVGFWIAAVLALFVFSPNILWNAMHGFVSFLHTRDNANLGGELFHLNKMLEFIAQQAGVFGPILFVTFVLCCFPLLRTVHQLQGSVYLQQESARLLFWFILPFLTVIITVSLLSRAHANWAAPVYVAATILVVAFLLEKKRNLWIWPSMGLHLVVAGLGLSLLFLEKLPGITISNTHTDLKRGIVYDPFVQVKGWEELGHEMSQLMETYPEADLLVDSRKLYAELFYYTQPHSFKLLKWNPAGYVQDHFDLTASFPPRSPATVEEPERKSFIFVSNRMTQGVLEGLKTYFVSVKPLKTVIINTQHPDNGHYEVYHVTEFKPSNVP